MEREIRALRSRVEEAERQVSSLRLDFDLHRSTTWLIVMMLGTAMMLAVAVIAELREDTEEESRWNGHWGPIEDWSDWSERARADSERSPPGGSDS